MDFSESGISDSAEQVNVDTVPTSNTCNQVDGTTCDEVENMDILICKDNGCDNIESPKENCVQIEGEQNIQKATEEFKNMDIEEHSTEAIPPQPVKLKDLKVNFNDGIELIASTMNFFSPDQYLKGCKWSPDGSCILTNCADHRLRLFDLPKILYTKSSWNKGEELHKLKPSLTIKDGGIIYDYDWFPYMSSWSPATCCFLSASHRSPVHLFDAFTGKIRASYSGLDYAEEVISAFSVKFSLCGAYIYCGYRGCLKIFDAAVPGISCTSLNLKKLNDQSGIISCIEENPAMKSLIAAGSYQKTIGLYTVDGNAVCLMKGHRGGITHLSYSQDGTKLFSGSRMDKEILVWDLRNPGVVLYSLKRCVTTNQRIYFDITHDENYLITGGTDGTVLCFDLKPSGSETPLDPIFKFMPHADCVNGVSLNKHYPILATSSGKQHYPDVISDEEDDNMFGTVNTGKIENTVKLWWLGDVGPPVGINS